MKHITSKLLSLLLCLAMLMSMVPVAYADDTERTGVDNNVSISEDRSEDSVKPSDDETKTPVSGSAVSTNEELATAIANAAVGDTITLGEGEFTLPGSQSIYTGKSLTIKAADNAKVSFDMSAAVTLGGAKITFAGITFDYKTNGNYIGLQHADTLVYNNCTINGMVFLYAASETFNGCTFNQTSADAYNVWTYGARNVAFNGCTFNCVGKSVLLYNEGANDGTNLTVSNTEFIASASVEGKAAIEIDTHLMNGNSTVTVDGKTNATGFATGSNSNSPLWNDKTQTADTNKNTTVTVAGETVFAPAAQSTAVATVDNMKYETLQAAINAAKGGSTVRLLANVTLTETAVFPAGKTVHLNLVGHNITATGTALLINGTTDIQSTGGVGTIESTGSAAVAVGDNANLTVYSGTLKGREGAVITGTSTGAKIEIRTKPTLIATDNAVIAGNGSNREGEPNTILVKGGTFIGGIQSEGYIACGIYAPWNDNVTVSGGTFNITNGAGIVARAGTVKVTGGTFNCTGTSTGWVGDNKNQIPCAALVFDKAANYPALTDSSQILVSGGSFSTDPAANGATLYNGYAATQDENGMYGVRKANPAAEIEGVKYDTLQAAINAAQATKGGATIKLLANISTSSYYEVKGENPVTIDLNGHNITGSGISGLFYVTAKGDLTIKGEGTVTAVEDNGAAMAVWVRSPIAKVTLEGGTYTQQISDPTDPHFDLIYVERGNVYVKGGTYKGFTPDWTLNCKDEYYQSKEANIEVTGGTFVGFDPTNNKAEGENTNFVPAGYVSTKGADGNFVVTESANYVAAIGETKYTSLAEAIAAAKPGATVKMLADTKENVTISTRNLTLDLNGHTLNGGTEKGKPALTITARVTVMDSSATQTGTIMREDTAENSGVSSHYVIDVQGAGWLTFESGNVKNNSGNTEGKGASLVRVGDDSVSKFPGLNIKGGTFTQDNFIVIKVDRGDLFLNGGTLNCANSYAVENWHRATIKGGTVNGTAATWTYSGGLNSDLAISGGTVNGNVAAVSYDGSAGKKASVSITGGTVNGTLGTYTYSNGLVPTEETAKATIKVTGGTFSSDPTKYVVEDSSVTPNSDGTFGVAKAYLAQVGETSYYTMDEAFKAQTASGAEIVLLRDYTTGSTFNSGSVARVVDLNKHTWTCTGTDANSAAFEINYANASLTVKNGKIVSSQLVGLIPSASHGTITYDNSNLVFESVEMSTTATSGIETNGNNTNDSVTLKNSTLNVPNGFGIYFPSSGTLTIDNSTINAMTMGVQVCAGSLSINAGSTITVSGGPVDKIEGDGAIQDGAAISIVNRTGYKGLGNITVAGGTFAAKSGNAAIKAYDWKNNTAADFTANNNVAVSGGTFSSAVPEDLCAEGYEPIKNPDGTYGVKASTPVAVVNDVPYYTLKKAIAAVQDGDTVKLLADVNTPDTSYYIDKRLTIDLNGKTVTGSGYDGVFSITGAGAEVCIKNGAVVAVEKSGDAGKYTMAVWAHAAGCTVTLEALTVSQQINHTDDKQMDMIYASAGTIIINSGSFTSGTPKWTLNINDSAYKDGSANIIVNGGTFVGYDPRNAENEGKGTSLVADGVGINKDENGSFTAVPNMAAQIVDADGSSVAAYATLQAAVNAAKSGETVLMLTDVDLGNSYVKFYTSTNKATNVTVDLGGHTLSSSASSTITTAVTNWTIQNGTIKNTYPTVVTTGGAVNVPSSSSITLTGGETGLNIISESVGVTIRINNGAANVTIKDGVTISGQYGAYLYGSPNGYNRKYTGKTALTVDGGTINGTIAGIAVWGPDNKNVAATATLTVNGGTITSDKGFGIAGTGNADNQVATTINITGGTISSGADTAIYHPQNGTLTISGGTISGVTGGVQMCAGTLEVTGGTITATGNGDTSGKTGDGSIPDGAAVSIVNRNYPGGIPSATITGGTLTSANGVDAVNAYGWSNNAKTDWTERKDNMNVSGGRFSSKLEKDYCAAGFEPSEKNSDGTYSVQKIKVAEVNGTQYESLKAAIDAAKDGETVTLLADVIQNTMLTIDKNITLDLNGKKIYNTEDIWSDSKQTYELISVEAKVTITGNGSIEAKENDCYTINVKNGNLTIENGTFVGNISAVQVEKGTLTINGGEFKLLQKWEGTSKYLINCIDKNYVDKSAVVDIRGGKFVDFDPNVSPEKKVDGKAPSFVISAGIGVTKDADGNFTAVPNMAAQIVDADGNSVAAYAGHYNAIAAAKNGETVILLSDCKNFVTNTINANITIDLNGKTLSVGNNNPFFRTNGEVTIQNGMINSNYACVIVNAYNKLTLKNVKITGVTGDNGKNLVNVCSNAEVTIDKDTVLTASGSGVAVFIGQDADAQYTLNVYGKVIQNSKTYAICGNGSYKGTSTINIYDGAEVKSPICVAIYQPQAGVTNIYGGLVEGKCAIGIKSGALNISGGTVRGTANDNVLSDDNSNGNGISYDGSAIIVDSRATGYAGNVKINVTGGTVESYYSNAIREIGNDPSVTQLTELTVTGGNVFGASSKTANVTNDMLVRDISVKNVSVSGGTFNHEVQSEYCALGYQPSGANPQGQYTVEPAEGNAAMFDAEGKLIGYADVAAALANSNAKTVKLIANATAKVLALQNNITLDLNGYELDAQMLVGFAGTVIDSSEGEGLLKLANRDYLTLANNNSYLPLYDTVAQGYRFFSYQFKARGIAGSSADSRQFWFSIVFGSDKAYTLLKNAGHGLEIRLSLQVGTNDAMEAVVPQQAIALWVNAIKVNGGTYEADNAGFYMAVKGLSKIGDDTVTVTGIAKIKGVEVKSDGALIYPKTN